ncbi:MAG: SPW repeat protein [Caldisericaceae bacterium]|nr:SPW repeat protein [Caldisericaceae bacterium]
MWQGWVAGILGLWGIISPFIFKTRTGNMANDIIVGIIVAIAGFTVIKERAWQGWLAGILGIWWIIAGLIPALTTGAGHIWNDIIVGILVAIAGFTALRKENA